MRKDDLLLEMGFWAQLGESLQERIGIAYACEREGMSCLRQAVERCEGDGAVLLRSDHIREMCHRCQVFCAISATIQAIEEAAHYETTGISAHGEG